jgi:hypothetical protein
MKKNEILSFLPHTRTLNQGQTQGDWTLITWLGESTQGRYEDKQETQKKNKIAFDVLNAKELMQKL